MSKPSNLSVPKSGVSRFSKALPTVPGLDDYYSYYTDDDGESNIGGDNNNNNSSSSSNTTTTTNNNNTSHSRKNSEYSLPARTSSLASPPPANTLPLPPLPAPPPTKTLPPTPQTLAKPSSKVNSYSSTTSASIVATSSIAPSTPSSALSAGISSLQSPPLSAGSKMSIPRKPVANLKLPAPSPQYLAQPSPTFSLSSLLSAYMGDGDESQSPYLYETTPSISEIDRREVAAPGSEKSAAAAAAEASSVIAAATAAFPAVPSKPKATIGGSGSLPARPNAAAAAAIQYKASAERDLPPPPPKDEAAAELSTPSSPRPEIWKRRPHMTQASRELPGLTLDYSHGSTADTQLPADQDNSQAPPEPVKSAAQRAPPFAGGLPGRNIRPSLGAKDQPPSAAQTMGSETSKLKQIKDRLSSQRSESVSSTSSAKAGFPGAPAVQRPPTPEYRKEDAKQPTVEPFISPVSPASSPEAPRGASPDFSKDLPPQPPKDTRAVAPISQPISRKAIPVSPSQDLTAAKDSFRPPSGADSTSSQATVSPVLRKGDTAPAPVAAPVAAPVTASAPNDSVSVRPRVSGGTSTAAVQPQPDVIQADVSQIAKPKQSTPQPTSDPRLLKSDIQGLLYRGRDGTLYPEMKVEGEPHPRAAYFPTQTYSNLPKDGIIKARPLTKTHFDCFQQHKTMTRRSNKNCPLTCQACDRADLEDRWACSFCHLRICDACHRKLGSSQWDLRRLMGNLANAGPLSQSRPDTAPGLQATL